MLATALIHVWDRRSSRDNPPNIRAIPRTFERICIYAFEWAYMIPRRQDESDGTFTRRVYGTLLMMYTAECTLREVGVMLLQPRMNWSRMCYNLHNTRTPEGARSPWYMVVHDILLTHSSLHSIHFVFLPVHDTGHHTASTNGVRNRPGNLEMGSHLAGSDT